MRKRYLALFLAIATVMAQIIGTGQSAWAAEVVTEEALPQEGLPGEEEGDTDEDGLVIDKKSMSLPRKVIFYCNFRVPRIIKINPPYI